MPAIKWGSHKASMMLDSSVKPVDELSLQPKWIMVRFELRTFTFRKKEKYQLGAVDW